MENDCEAEAEDDQGSGWFLVKKKHRASSKFSVQGFVGEISCKVTSGIPKNQSSANGKSGKTCRVQRSHSEVKGDFGTPPRVQGKDSNFRLQEAEKVVHSLDKCIANQVTELPKLPVLRSASVMESNDKVLNKNLDGIPKIKWGHLDDETVLCTENTDKPEVKFVNLGDGKLECHKEFGSACEIAIRDSFCCERRDDKMETDAEYSPVETSSLAFSSEHLDICKELDELPSRDVRLLDAENKTTIINDPNIRKVCDEHAVEPVNNMATDAIHFNIPGTANSLFNVVGAEKIISSHGYDKSDDGTVDIPEALVEDRLSSKGEDKQASVSRPVQEICPEPSGDELIADVTNDILPNGKVEANSSNAYIAGVEEIESAESKERFRQRLWCFLFENLNRAVDELYLLCELECDLEQMKEAILVLEEAASDFKELKSRVECFEHAKSCSFQQSIDGALMNPKNDHRRPHSLSWEVRRMVASPHRAEILSSSLETFKKIQEQRTRSSLACDGKSLDPAFGNDLSSLVLGNSGEKNEEMNPVESVVKPMKHCSSVKDLGVGSLVKEKQDADGSKSTETYIVQFGSCDSDCISPQVSLKNLPPALVAGRYKKEQAGSASDSDKQMRPIKDKMSAAVKAEKNIKCTEQQRRKILLDKEKEKEKRNMASWKSLDAWKEKRNWEDVLATPTRPSSRVSHSPGIFRSSVERSRVLHDKLMSPEKKKKTALDLKKEAEEKHARATRIRSELENERVQRLQRTSEKLNRVNEWQAVRTMKLREGMHARHQRSETRHEAHLAEVVRRAGDESSKVNEVRFITSLNEENKKLILRQKLHDSELRRAEKRQMIKTKQKEDMAREEAALERRRQLQDEKLRRLAEIQRKKEEALVRREEERKASSAAREARAIEQVRRLEYRARAQQEEAELLAQKLAERLSESEQRRKFYLEQIRERASMDFRDQSSPSLRRSSHRDSLCRSPSIGNAEDCQANHISSIVNAPLRANDHAPKQPLKRRIKKIRQRLMALKYEFSEPSVSAETAGVAHRNIIGTARAKIGRWIQELQRLRQARKGAASIGLIISDMIKFLEGKEPELHAARQAGLLDFIASALPASHSSRSETCQVTIHLVRLLRVVLFLPANRSYFLAQNLLPPIIPMLSAALENYIKIAASLNAPGSTTSLSSRMSIENFESVSELIEGFLWTVTTVMGHVSLDEWQVHMHECLLELVISYQVIQWLRDLFALHDRPQVEGSNFPSCIVFSLNLLVVLTSMPKTMSVISWGDLPSEAMSANVKQDRKLIDLMDAGNSSLNINERDESSSLSALNADKNEPLSDVPEDRPLDGTYRVKSRDTPSNITGLAKNQDDVSVEQNGDHLRMHVTGSSRTNDKIESPAKSSSHQKALNGLFDVDVVQKNDHTKEAKHPVAFLLSVIVETSLVSLPSLLTAVLLQANSRSASEQGSYVLPSNFEEVATGVLKVLNNLALLDIRLIQRMLGRPDLKMEFFHLMSFLLSHCCSKWKAATDQVGQLLLESLLLLGYFGLLHPGNQAVLRWGKSPTILQKVCDLPFAFFSDPELMPTLAATLVAACYGCEQNRVVVQLEISTEMLLSLLASCRKGLSAVGSNSPQQEDTAICNLLECNLSGLDPRKSQADMSVRCSRSNLRSARPSITKLGPNGSSSRGSKLRNHKDGKTTKTSEIKNDLIGSGPSSTIMLHNRFSSSFVDKAENFFSAGLCRKTEA
ncbi:hypothetical protein Scep_004594 [Stephania cephalantha]|uniref:S phase cyclin A-associated protein in the endoplasmic reticulum N-terminal domain-containing protein n=1 Tax=Stephania cephalantha TaxID=152367 RepID=A0AAP0PWS5_9MAGN